MSWNIDGLDGVGGAEALMRRSLAVALEVGRRRPFAVFLQECVPAAIKLLEAKQVLGGSYDFHMPRNPKMPYYVAILTDRRRVQLLQGPETIDFPWSQMGRQLLSVTVTADGRRDVPLILATAHLESTKDCGGERTRQLSHSLNYMRTAALKVVRTAVARGGVAYSRRVAPTCVFGGDLNLRDEEFRAVQKELGDAASGIEDVWSWCGSDEAERYTWDTSVNTNLDAGFKSRTRFDRLFFLAPGISAGPRAQPGADGGAEGASKHAGAGGNGWQPIDF